MAGDKVPEHMMTPERVAWAQSIGLAQRLPVVAPEPVEPPPEPKAEPKPPLRMVGQTITGRAALVLQVPGGQVRFEGTMNEAVEKARVLASGESATFAVYQAQRVIQPKTIVQEDVVTE